MVNMPPPHDIPSRPSLSISTDSRTIRGSRTSRAASISRKLSRGQLKGKGRQASATGSYGHSDRWLTPDSAGVEGMSMRPQPVKIDGSFIMYESPGGASSPSMAAESSEQAAGKRRRTDPSPGPSPRRQTASSSRRSSWAAPQAESEATAILALMRESDMPAWVVEDRWERFDGNVERIRQDFQLIQNEWSAIAETTDRPIWVVQGAWSRCRGDRNQTLEEISRLR